MSPGSSVMLVGIIWLLMRKSHGREPGVLVVLWRLDVPISNVYSFFDLKGKTYSPPFLKSVDGLAVRTAMEILSDPQSMLAKYPGDFDLFRVGTFDDSSALMTPLVPVVHVQKVSNLVSKGDL